MLILVMMLLIGLVPGVWGFMMCFLPARWDRLTEAMSFAGRWTEPSPKRLHPLIRFGNRVSGLVIFAVGCWFAYVAASKIYLVVTGRAVSHTADPVSALSNSPTPALNGRVAQVIAGVPHSIAFCAIEWGHDAACGTQHCFVGHRPSGPANDRRPPTNKKSPAPKSGACDSS
jgi:hypothetical protein